MEKLGITWDGVANSAKHIINNCDVNDKGRLTGKNIEKDEWKTEVRWGLC